jgi:hypothetical protein
MSSAIVAALEVVLQREQAPAMEELRRELAAARRANLDLDDHIQWIEARHDSYIEALTEDNAELEQRIGWLAVRHDAEIETLMEDKAELERQLAIALANCSTTVRLMRQDDDEADEVDDAEMEVDSAAVP